MNEQVQADAAAQQPWWLPVRRLQLRQVDSAQRTGLSDLAHEVLVKGKFCDIGHWTLGLVLKDEVLTMSDVLYLSFQ